MPLDTQGQGSPASVGVTAWYGPQDVIAEMLFHLRPRQRATKRYSGLRIIGEYPFGPGNVD